MVVKIKSPFCQGIESASSPDCIPWMYNILHGPYSLGSWVRGGPYSLREYGPPDRKLGRTAYPMTPAEHSKLHAPWFRTLENEVRFITSDEQSFVSPFVLLLGREPPVMLPFMKYSFSRNRKLHQGSVSLALHI